MEEREEQQGTRERREGAGEGGGERSCNVVNYLGINTETNTTRIIQLIKYLTNHTTRIRLAFFEVNANVSTLTAHMTILTC